MEDIFEREKQVIHDAQALLEHKAFRSDLDEALYEKLLLEYKRLLRQMRTMVKMSDIMQSKLNSMSAELEKLSQTDGLTGLYNRRYFNETFQKVWQESGDSQKPLGVLMIDIDYFKKYNDTYGHLDGDQCLQKIAATIKQAVEGSNAFVARFGGEEFVVLLQEKNYRECLDIAAKVLDSINQLRIPNHLQIEPSCCSTVSVSIGVGFMTPDKEMKGEILLNEADQALYRAKKDGRRCCR